MFATSSFFTIVIFRVKYGQSITLMDVIGTMLIFLCVVLIGIGGAQNETEEK